MIIMFHCVNRAVVSVILKSSSWKHALRVSYPSYMDEHTTNSARKSRRVTNNDREQENEGINSTTPFRELIKTMPGALNNYPVNSIVYLFDIDNRFGNGCVRQVQKGV